jgi:hypothetical protein
MDNQSFSRKLRRDLKSYAEIPGLVVKLQAEGLLTQLEKAVTYAFDTCENPDEQFKENLKVVVNSAIDVIYDSNSSKKD